MEESKPKRKFIPLSKSLYDILRKICEHKVISLPKIRSEHPDAKNNRWYNQNEFYDYHFQKGHDTNKCRTL